MDDIEARRMRITRTVHASLETVWALWTVPEHIAAWWGPKDFTTTINQMTLTEDSEWLLTLHGPDGTNYPNRSIFKEIVILQKIVFEHFNPHFLTTVLFEPENEMTKIEWTMLFDTIEIRDIIVKAHKADEGQKENLDKLENYLKSITP